MIGRMHHVVIDCPNPRERAAFYSELIGMPITCLSDDWVVVSVGERATGVAFQLAPDHRPPRWPDPDFPQQFHIDVMVDDVAEAADRVLELGARRLGGDVFADPAGHPFCLIPRPPGYRPSRRADRPADGRPRSRLPLPGLITLAARSRRGRMSLMGVADWRAKHMRDPVRGVFRVTGFYDKHPSSTPPGTRITGVITAPGIPATPAEHKVDERGRWADHQELPVLVDRSDPSRFAILWNEVGQVSWQGREMASAQAEADRLNAGEPGYPPYAG
jgi:catechol 2,3-dioxygenase-like lactoylglutathione lyase family enzyme